MNLGTLAVLIVLGAVVALVIRTMVRDKKRGRSCCGGGSGCSGDCSKCSGCH